jgi:hypothetical protein
VLTLPVWISSGFKSERVEMGLKSEGEQWLFLVENSSRTNNSARSRCMGMVAHICNLSTLEAKAGQL